MLVTLGGGEYFRGKRLNAVMAKLARDPAADVRRIVALSIHDVRVI